MMELNKSKIRFLNWLNNVTTDEVATDHPECKHYHLIEGFKDGQAYNVSFAKFKDDRLEITLRANYPKSEQIFTVEQFHEWMERPEKHNRTFLQQF